MAEHTVRLFAHTNHEHALASTQIVATSIGQNPFTETIYFRKYSVYEGFLGENTRLRELRRRRAFGRFWAVVGNFGLFGTVFA
jgi:hypothetical protein